MPQRFRLALLGPPVVLLGNRMLLLPTRKTLALLIYLPVEGGPQPREKLAALLWPDYDAAGARQALRTTLARLRRAVDGDAVTHNSSSLLALAGGMIGLQVDAPLDVDLWTVERTIHAIRTPHVPADGILPILREAAALCRGDFLDGFSLPDSVELDDWVTTQRAYWLRRSLEIFDRLSRAQFDAGDPVAALETATRWQARDPLDEAAVRRIMRLHFACGDRAAALQVFETCRATLRRELGTEPVPQTIALARRLQMTPPPTPLWDHRNPAARWDPPLVGREAEHAAMAAAFHRALAGDARGVVIVGEAGMGKSKLAQAFETWALTEGAMVMRGRAYEMGGRMPYQVLVEALRPRLLDEATESNAIDAVWLTELSRLMPELAVRWPGLPQPFSDEAVARNRLFEAVVQVGVAMTARLPAVLFIDDVQWADPDTLELLAFASRRWAEERAPLMLLLTVRTEDLTLDSGLAPWLAELGRSRDTIRVPLSALTLSNTISLVAALARDNFQAPSDTAAEFGQWLFAETKGQPFYLAETLAMLADEGAHTIQSESDGHRGVDLTSVVSRLKRRSDRMPPRVREVISARLRRLNRPSSDLLAAAAVLGQRFAFEHARRVAHLSEEVALSALDMVSHAGLLRIEPVLASQSPRYTFGHDMVREVVYNEAGDARRHVFHRRAFQTLRRAAAAPAVVAYHAARAGLAAETFQWSLDAGDEALRLFALADAVNHYATARDALDRDDTGVRLTYPSLPQLSSLYCQLGRAHELAGDFGHARDAYTALLAVSRERSDSGFEATALNRLATVTLLSSVDFESTSSLLAQARDVGERSGNMKELAETEWSLAQLGFYQLDAAAAIMHGSKALELARKFDKSDLAARSLNVIAYGHAADHNWEAVEVHAREGQMAFTALGNRVLTADSQAQLSMALVAQGRASDGVRLGRQAYAASIEIANTWGQISSGIHLALGLLDTGEFGAAFSVARTVADAGRAAGSHMLPAVLARLGTIYRSMLMHSQARTTHEEALAMDERVIVRPFSPLNAAELCADLAVVGNWDEAYRHAVWATDHAERSLLYLRHSAWYEVEALLRSGDEKRAQRVIAWLYRQAERAPRTQVPYVRSLAVLAHWQGDRSGELGHLSNAHETASRLELCGELWHIDVALAETYAALGDAASADAAVRHARDIVYQLAARIGDDTVSKGFLAGAEDRLRCVGA